ncbi:alpha/beta hydrolase [Streptomyces sp. NPDC053755]|uniref:alpha/beta fold hydrolase n=1 Tax=Streptomyces sp. NPDC053755 TaxID=3155815 RepID=UPI00342EBC9D
MPRTSANGIELEYDTIGSPRDPALLLVMGLYGQLTHWDTGFCRMIADHGYHVIRYDNRDSGLSTSLDDLAAPGPAFSRDGAPYVISDMADDAVGLLDALGIDRAHVVGVSMGGMIAQELAIDHADRLLSLCSIMSTTGERSVGRPRPGIFALLAPTPAGTRDAVIEAAVATRRAIGSPGFPLDDAELRLRAAASYDRAHRPAGGLRQIAAIGASPARADRLRHTSVPALVIHGEDDPLIDVSGGRATAAAIPGATLLTIPGMGHDLPSALWPTIVGAIVENTRRAVPGA